MIPKARLEWQEPALFKSFQGKPAGNAVRLSIQVFVVVAAMGGCFLYWDLAGGNSAENHVALPAMLTVGAAIGGLVAFGMPVMRAKSPYQVGLFEKGISRANRNDIRFWKYENIASAAVAYHQHQTYTLRVLTLYLKDGSEVTAGIADGVSTDAIVALFAGQGINCSSA